MSETRFDYYEELEITTVVARLGNHWITARLGTGRVPSTDEYKRWREWADATLQEIARDFAEEYWSPIDLPLFKSNWFRWESILGYCPMDIGEERLLGVRVIIRRGDRRRELLVAQLREHTYIREYPYVNDFIALEPEPVS